MERLTCLCKNYGIHRCSSGSVLQTQSSGHLPLVSCSSNHTLSQYVVLLPWLILPSLLLLLFNNFAWRMASPWSRLRLRPKPFDWPSWLLPPLLCVCALFLPPTGSSFGPCHLPTFNVTWYTATSLGAFPTVDSYIALCLRFSNHLCVLSACLLKIPLAISFSIVHPKREFGRVSSLSSSGQRQRSTM